jgi:putative hydrolase of the HAD superfamily
VSNTIVPREAIDTVLRDHGLLDFFPVRVYSSEVRFMKPDARIFQIALGELDAAPERTLFIGDHVVNDIKGAAGVGMKTVLAVHGERVPRTPLCPDHVIRELAELPPILSAYAK